MTLTSKMNLNNKSLQSLKRSLRMEALETRQMLSAVSPFANAQPVEEADSAFVTDLQPTGTYTAENLADISQVKLIINTGDDSDDSDDSAVSLRKSLVNLNLAETITVKDNVNAIDIASNITISGIKTLELNNVPIVAETEDDEEQISINIENAQAVLLDASFQNVNINIDTNSEVSIYSKDENLMINGNTVANTNGLYRIVNGTVLEGGKYDWYIPGNLDVSYVLETADDFVSFAELVEMGASFENITVKLGANIDLEGIEMSPIGTEANPFLGNFDGQGFTISNVTISANADAVGLFGQVGNAADKTPNTIKNFKINNISVTGLDGVGAVVGAGYSLTIDSVEVTNVTINGIAKTGGIVGRARTLNNCKVTNCSVTSGTITQACDTDDEKHVGGIAGFWAYADVENCTVEDLEISGRYLVGGITGSSYDEDYTNDDMRVKNCTVENVTLNASGSNADDDFPNVFGVGAISGLNDYSFSGEDSGNSFMNVDAYGAGNILPVQTIGLIRNASGETSEDAEEPVCIIVDADGNTYASSSNMFDIVDVLQNDSEGKSLKLLADVELNDNIWLPEDVELLTNGFSFSGKISSEGTITINGVTYGKSDEDLTFVVADDEVALVVTAQNTNPTDNETSLEEALAVNAENGIIKFADTINYIRLGEDGISVLDGNGAILRGDIQFSAFNGPSVIRDITLDGIQIWNDDSMTIADVTFTGDYSEIGSVLWNTGEITLENVCFTDIFADSDLTEDEWYGMSDFRGYAMNDYAEGITNTFTVINNWGDMAIAGVEITGTNVTFTTDRLDNFAELDLIANNVRSTLTVDGLLVAENTLNAETNRGDISAFLYGVRNEGLMEGANIIMFGNAVSTVWDTRFEDIAENVEEGVYGIATFIKDVELTNVTMLEKLYGYRADFYMANSIYSSENAEFVRGFLVNAEIDGTEAPNLDFAALKDLEAIFPFFDAETNTFELNADGEYDLRMWLDSEIVDAGNNDFSAGLTVDVLGNNRFNNEIVDLGAVESNAQKLTVDGLVATPDGTSKAILTWSESANASGYVLRYYTGTEAKDSIADDEWTEVTGETLEDLQHIVDGLASRTWVAFQVMALGDNLSWIDSDWSETASCWTKSPFPAPVLVPSLESPLAIDLAWPLVPGASESVSDVPYTLEFCIGTMEDLEAGKEFSWTALPNAYSLNNNYGAFLISEALNGVDLEYSTTYLFRVKVNGVGEYVDSKWSYAEKKTGAKLEAPALEADERTDSAITVTWDDTVNKPSQVKAYKVQYRETGTENWIDLEVSAGADVDSCTAENLKPGTRYDFSVMVTGQKVYNNVDQMADDSEWSDVFTFSTKTKLDAPAPVASAENSSTITVTWEGVENAVGYRVTLLDNQGNAIGESANYAAEVTSATFNGLNADTEYNVVVIALGADEFMDSNGGYGEAWTWIKLAAPVMTQDSNSETHVTMTWEAVLNSTGYDVQYSLTGPDADDFQWLEDLDDANLKFTVTEDGVKIPDLDEVRQIWFKIRALGQDGVSETSEWSTDYVVGKTKGTLVFANGLTAKGISTSEIKLTWDAVAGAESYKISYKTGNGNVQRITVDDPEATTTTITGLDGNTLYDVTIQAMGDGENTVSSDIISASATTWLQLDAPSLTIGEITDTTVSGTFNAIDFAAGYVVEFSADGGQTWSSENVTVNANALTFTANVEPNTTCVFRVMAEGSAPEFIKVGEASKVSVDSEWNQCGDRVTTLLYLDAPEITANVADTQKSATLTWTAVDGAENYELVLKDAEGNVIGTWTLSETEKVVDVDSNRQYTATVKALGNGGNIKDSAEATCDFETEKLAMGPIDLNAEFDGSNDSIEVTWNAVEGAASYTLKYQKAGDTEWTTEELGADETALTLTKSELEQKTTYNFEIIANASADYDGTPTDSDSVYVPATVEMTAVVLRNPSAADADTIPTTEKWVDEWTNVFVEVWVEDTSALVEGREVSFSLTIDSMYNVQLVDRCDGIQIEQQNDGTWKVTVTSSEAIESPARLACFKLTVNNGNGVDWVTQKNTEAFKFKGEAIETTVYAVPGDMNDDGLITMTQDQADDTRFDVELGKESSWADFDHDGDVDLYDRQWMLDNNQGKVWYDSVIKYTDDVNENGPFMYSPVGSADAGLMSTSGAVVLREMPEVRVFEVAVDDREEVTVKPLAVDEADPIPVVKDINTLSGNGKVKEEAAAEIGEQAKNTETQVLDLLFGANVDFFA